MITVTLPTHLRDLAKVSTSVKLQVDEPITQESILDALEETYPMLRGTIRDIVTKKRRPFIRFFANGEDLSHQSPSAAVPKEVAEGTQPFRIIGAMAGG